MTVIENKEIRGQNLKTLQRFKLNGMNWGCGKYTRLPLVRFQVNSLLRIVGICQCYSDQSSRFRYALEEKIHFLGKKVNW